MANKVLDVRHVMDEMVSPDGLETGGGSSDITVTQIQSTGIKIAEIEVDGNTTELFAPQNGGGSDVSSELASLSTENSLQSSEIASLATQTSELADNGSTQTSELSSLSSSMSEIASTVSSTSTAQSEIDASQNSHISSMSTAQSELASETAEIASETATKQPMLTPGSGITIDENNVISATGGGGGGGAAASYLDNVDLNTITTPGVYTISNNCTNRPPLVGIGTLVVSSGSPTTNSANQTFLNAAGYQYGRVTTNSGSTWTAWNTKDVSTDSVSVRTDGVKTFKTLLGELYTQIDSTKVKKTSQLLLSGVYFNVAQILGNAVKVYGSHIPASTSYIRLLNANISSVDGAFVMVTIDSSNGVRYEDYSSQVPPSGGDITLYYN